MITIIAGFYCEPAELAENDRFTRNLGLAFCAVAAAYVALWVYIAKRLRSRRRAVVIAVHVAFAAGAVLLTLGWGLMNFVYTPHWCGN